MVLLPFDDCQFCDDNAGGGKGGEWGEGATNVVCMLSYYLTGC